MGAPIPLTPAGGEDLGCIGTPEGYTKVYYDRSTDVDGTFVQVAYVKEGDHLSSVEGWVRSRTNACGFDLKGETAGSTYFATGKSLEYERNNGNESLQVDVGTLRGSDGKTYTFVYFNYTEWNQEAYGEGSETGTAEEQEEQGGVNNVVGPAAKYVDLFREILRDAFGANVTIKQADYVANTYHYDFILSRSIVEEDAQPLIDDFQEKGFSLLPENQQGEHVSLGFTRNNEWLQADYDIGGNIVTIIYVPGGG